MLRLLIILILISFFKLTVRGQVGYGNIWVLGYTSDTPEINGCLLDFNFDPVKITSLKNNLLVEGSSATMCDSKGSFQFYSNGCAIAGADHITIENGDSIGLGLLESSFCHTGGNPQTQGILALPLPENDSIYYLFYTNIETPYAGMQFFPLAPTALYYAIIDMTKNEGKGKVISKNQLIISDTLSRVMMQATMNRDRNGWWVILPESHSNCYYVFELTSNGIDSIGFQCIGSEWGDEDLNGQVVFSPNGLKFARFNYYYGLNTYDFDNINGLFSNDLTYNVSNDVFTYSGVAFSPNSRFIYTTTTDKLYQFDTESTNIEASKILVDQLFTPDSIQFKTRFNQIQLAPNGRIYIGGTNSHNYLHVINNPNCLGKSCDFEQYAIKLPCYNQYGLPNNPNYNYEQISIPCDTMVDVDRVPDMNIKIYPNPFVDEIFVNYYKPIKLVLFNSLGVQVINEEMESGISRINIFKNMPAGIYHFKLYDRNVILKTGNIVKI